MSWGERPEQDFSWSFRRAQERNLATALGGFALGLLFILIVVVPLVAAGWAWVFVEGR